MFETAELGQSIDKDKYKQELPNLREDLLEAQFDLAQEKKFPTVIIIAGMDGAGKGTTVNTLNYWMDPRNIHSHAMGTPSDEEKERPPMWRYWRALPPKGAIGIFFGSWYTTPLIARVYEDMKTAHFDHAIDEINHFERMLANENALILKFWLHLSKKDLKERLTTLEQREETRWRVSEYDWKRFENYDTYKSVAEDMLRRTSNAFAPWSVVESVDERYRSLTVGKILHKALRDRLDDGRLPAKRAAVTAALNDMEERKNVLDTLDLTRALEKSDYKKKLAKYQALLNQLSRNKIFREKSMVIVFEGNDAAGKGGAIRRVCGALDARFYDIIPIGAPSDEELAHPYLWRFWRNLPRQGNVTVFDRSWYGRVLVERVEGLSPQSDWMRAYGEINRFEQQMNDHGTLVVKFWLSVDKDEQLRRFQEREASGFKRFKLTDEDWRNRDKWDDYARAVNDMVERTSTPYAPWTLVEANNKYYARIKVLKTVCKRLQEAIDDLS
ncbi:polyphosphate:AMP phosphotransferase [Varunaivibrio sulfuroxidans]|uniref:Polyphosphate:AMP phosphotransferase n=1 Tax=Varunaivibrio sulfuroxidans TaxID=1773489 RepID=A0A4R3JEJ8_9PROT|nr:polyphosphate:AMP phosphotransferase [Varunaivibrio sulfuroxidans]TCS64322.1 polyphosphate:AMP phosphotransferase [Varunaivibrio sulfuroxidans]WES31241.1 polyphosphate:AMP phosphotransferase [Varunaivibrio sulfuroxidans]